MKNDEFKDIVSRYEKLVFTICFQMTQDYYRAQDLTQETFLSAYLHLESCREETIRPWLARIATNKAKDYLKSAYQRTVQLSDNLEDLPLGSEPPVDDSYIRQESVDALEAQIYSLKEPYLHAAILFFIKDRPIEEIAQTLNRPKKTVETQIYRARHLLQKKLKEGT